MSTLQSDTLGGLNVKTVPNPSLLIGAHFAQAKQSLVQAMTLIAVVAALSALHAVSRLIPEIYDTPFWVIVPSVAVLGLVLSIRSLAAQSIPDNYDKHLERVPLKARIAINVGPILGAIAAVALVQARTSNIVNPDLSSAGMNFALLAVFALGAIAQLVRAIFEFDIAVKFQAKHSR
jgi:hypothetical protein